MRKRTRSDYMPDFDFSKIKIRNPDRLHFGTAGIPLKADPRTTADGVNFVSKLGLSAMELEFVRHINLNPKTAALVYDSSKKSKVILTTHGSYFINLNAVDKEIVIASKKRILEGATVARLAGSWSMTFHAAYYLKDDKQVVYDRVKEQLKHIVSELKDSGNEIWIRPETTGKGSQFGELKEIIKLSNDVENVLPCVDFAHLHARTGGKNNTLLEFREILSEIEKGLGKRGLDNMHIHMSGIAYTAKGERNHLFLEESDFNYKDLIKVWKEYKIKGVVISESPNIEEDALLMKKYWDGMK